MTPSKKKLIDGRAPVPSHVPPRTGSKCLQSPNCVGVPW
jgi:hypothetical protein